jgi:hypothetical protein
MAHNNGKESFGNVLNHCLQNSTGYMSVNLLIFMAILIELKVSSFY